MRVKFSPLIQKKISGLKLGILLGKNLSINNQLDLVCQQLSDLTIFIKKKFADQLPSKDPIISAVRRMYRRIGCKSSCINDIIYNFVIIQKV
jgi:hypothetical protein